MSYLTEVRGLKLGRLATCAVNISSYLTEVRGLKHIYYNRSIFQTLVVPYRGTWVETLCKIWNCAHSFVVSFTGMWVEIQKKRLDTNSLLVVPLQDTTILFRFLSYYLLFQPTYL